MNCKKSEAAPNARVNDEGTIRQNAWSKITGHVKANNVFVTRRMSEILRDHSTEDGRVQRAADLDGEKNAAGQKAKAVPQRASSGMEYFSQPILTHLRCKQGYKAARPPLSSKASHWPLSESIGSSPR
jgi:hypothetical protein